MDTISVLGIENVVVVHGYGARGIAKSWDADQPEALAMVEEGHFRRFVVECACGCIHYVNDDMTKFANSDRCDDHERMHAGA